KRKNVRNAAIFVLIAVLACGAFYVRTWLWTGNPVFPFFTRIFGDNEWRGSLLETTMERALLPSHIESNPVAWLLRLSYDADTLKNQAPYAISFYLLPPLLVWAWLRIPRLRVVGAIAFLYLLLFAAFDARFFLPSAAIF